jgi:broad specificity phosphatase PhoE
VFTSDLRRAVETAEIAFGGSGIPVFEDRRLRECDYGELNGMPTERLLAERSHRIDVPYPAGESYRDVVVRVRAFLEDVAAEHDGSRVVLIGHSATRWALDHLLTGTPLEELVDAPFAWREGWEYVLERGGSAPH